MQAGLHATGKEAMSANHEAVIIGAEALE